MLPDYLVRYMEISIGVGLVALILFCATPFFRRYFTPVWKYWLWLLLSVRLFLPAAPLLAINPFSLLERLESSMSWLVWGWLGGILLLLLVFTVAYLRFRLQCLRWSVSSSSQTQQIADRLYEELHITRRIPIAVSLKVSSPLVIGLLKPTLLLPHENYAEEDLTHILKHELLHYKHWDVWYKLVVILACTLHWFNPAVWLIWFQTSIDLEILRDTEILRYAPSEERQRYSGVILRTVHAGWRTGWSIFSTYFYGGVFAIRQRVRQIARGSGKVTGMPLLACVAILCFAGGMTDMLTLPTLPASLFLAKNPVQTDPTPPVESAGSQPVSSSSAVEAVIPPKTVSTPEISTAASAAELQPSETSSTAEASVSAAESVPPEVVEPVVKTPGVVPANAVFLSCVQEITAQYRDGLIDTSMVDVSKGVFMPAPANLPLPVVESDTMFSVNINQQGYGIAIPFAARTWVMSIWVKDIGSADAYVFEVTAVSFSAVSSAPVAQTPTQVQTPQQTEPAASSQPTASSANGSTITSGRPKASPPKKSGLLG